MRNLIQAPTSLLREPLVHFLVIGAVLFALFRFVEEPAPSAEEIVVTRGQIDQLATSFRLVWQREPTAQELEGLIEDFIREEVLYREAVALGLDRGDTVIRRRMRQKLEFLAEDLSAQVEPDEETLLAWFRENGDAYVIDEGFSFQQIYLNPDRHGENLEEDVAGILQTLSAAGEELDIATLGDPILLPPSFTEMPRIRVEQTFGSTFINSLENAATGTWVGPVASGYGQHIVRITGRVPGGMPELAQVRDAVARDWAVARQQQTLDAHYQALREAYTIRIENEAEREGDGPDKEVRR